MSEKKLRSIKPYRRPTISGWTNKIHVAADNNSSSCKALVRVKLEKDKHFSSDTTNNSSSGKAIVAVKLEKEQEDEEDVLHVTRSVLKRKQLSQSVDNNNNSLIAAVKREHNNTFERQRTSQRRMIYRWNTERMDSAEQAMEDILKEIGASFEKPISRCELRAIARKRIGDTGLLDHLLKHIDGNVTPGGAERFRRCYNTEGAMQYWLESADLLNIKRESGVLDPNWVPPPWWNSNRLIKLEPGDCEASFNLKEAVEKMKSDIKELVADVVHIKRETGVPDPDLIPLAQWKIKSASHEASSTVSSKLREEIDNMKSDIKKLVSKPKLPDHADANEKVFKECMSWKVETDKKIAEISNSLTSTQGMVKELTSWKDKVEQQLVGISNSQANGSKSPHNWENLLHSASLDDFTVNGFEPWDVEADLTDVLPEAGRPDIYSLPPNARKGSFQDHMWFEEQSVLNSEMQRTERGDSRSSNQDKAELTPGSSVTAGPRSDIDDPSLLSQETLKELVSWKAKAEQQIMEMSDAVRALQG